MSALEAFRGVTSSGSSDYEILDGSHGSQTGLGSGKILRVGSHEFDLDGKTMFHSDDEELGFLDLRTVVNCWETRGLSVADYIQRSGSLNIPNLKFIERTDLIEWLDGSSETSDFLKKPEAVSYGEDAEMLDAELASNILERAPALDHSTILHGPKKTDFSNVATICHKLIVSEFRHASSRPASSAKTNGTSSGLAPLKPTKGKDPIILLSPSPSSLINMANVKDFLENGVFTPILKGSSSPNFLRIVRNSKNIGHRVRFVVVDSVDQFKLEYWDRVVAVFATGQEWQFREYRWHDPNTLFHNVLGFGAVYKNDPVPDKLKQWNVKIEALDRNTRFRDREVVERIWERIEDYMISRGWPVDAH